MSFTFLHTADWQLGKPFGGFDAEKQPVLRRARLQAIDALADKARDAGARHILVAGDIYDAGDASGQLLEKPLGKLAAHKDLTWHLLPGNHDPAVTGGLWDRAAATGLAGNIIIHRRSEPFEVAKGVYILPSPLLSRSVSADPTGWMDDALTPEGALRIGLAHGSVRGFGSEREAAVNISPSRPRSAALDYLALGDWHGVLRISDRVWYSGTPEPDQFPDNSPGYALIVRIAGPSAVPEVEKVATAAYIWEKKAVDLRSADDIGGLITQFEALGVELDNRLLQLKLSGTLNLEDDALVAARLDALEHRLFHLERRAADLHVVPADADLAMIGDGALRKSAERLAAIARDGADDRGPAAELALRRLFVLARESGGGGA